MGNDSLSVEVGSRASVITNDRYDDALVTAAAVKVTLLSSTLPQAELSAAGDLVVPARTLAGTYLLAYQICQSGAATDCGTGTASVTVTVPTVVFPADGLTINQFLESQSPAQASQTCGSAGSIIVGGTAQGTIGGCIALGNLTGTSISVNWIDDANPRGVYDLPKSEIAAMFSEFYPLSGADSSAINGALFWKDQLARVGSTLTPEMRAEIERVIAAYEAQLAASYPKSRDQFLAQLTAPLDAATQREVDDLTRQINAKMVQIRKADSTGKAVSQLVNLVTLGTAGFVADIASEAAVAVLEGELASLVARRAQIDHSAQLGVVAASLTNRVMNLLERGDPYSAEESALIGQVQGMVQKSAVQVAEANERYFNNWIKEQNDLRAMQGVNLAVLFDTGTPVPNFLNEAMAAAGLGPAGIGFSASASFFVTDTVAIAGNAADLAKVTTKLRSVIYPYWEARKAGTTATEVIDVATDAARTTWQSAKHMTPETKSLLTAMDDIIKNFDTACDALQATRVSHEAVSAAAAGADAFKFGTAAMDMVEAGAAAAKGAATAAKASKGIKSVLSSALKAAGPIGDVASIALEVAIAAGQAADAWDNGATRLADAAEKARSTPPSLTDLKTMTSTVEGRAQLIAVLAGQLAQRSPAPTPVVGDINQILPKKP